MIRVGRLLTRPASFNTVQRYTHAQALSEKDVEEIRIPVPWGHIAGRWWGSKDRRPVVCLHGWQDNAGSFDNIIPLLTTDHSYLAIDFPGHGRSSHYQKGCFYMGHEYIPAIRRIQKYFNWDKMSFMGHSLGSIQSFTYSTIFPQEVDFYIGFDALKPIAMTPEEGQSTAANVIEETFLLESLDPSKTPVYQEDSLMKRWIKGVDGSLTEESCKILLKRGSVKVENGVQLSRDAMLKTRILVGFTQDEIKEWTQRVTCDVCILKFKDWRYFDNEKNFHEILNILRGKCKNFEFHMVDGTHHAHMNNPERIAPIINNFLRRISPT